MIIDVAKQQGLPCVGWEMVYKEPASPTGYIVYSSKVEQWHQLPKTGVILAIWWHDYHVPGVRKKTLSVGENYYIFRDQNKWGDTDDLNEANLFDYREGVWVMDELMKMIWDMAFQKLDF